jgi:hypothetical protein
MLRLVTGAKDPMALAGLVAANLIPLAGVLFLGWDAAAVVILYWAENLIIGVISVLKIALAPAEQPSKHVAKVLLIPFFCVHYGGFCAVHGFFLLVLFVGKGAADSVFPHDGGWGGPLVFIQMLYNVIGSLWAALPAGTAIPLLALSFSHGVSFVQNFLLGEERKQAAANKLMGQPYKRIFTMHVAIIFGGVFVAKLTSPVPLVAILVLLKLGLDIKLHRMEHEKKKPAVATAGVD